MNTLTKIFGENLKKIRKSLGLSQEKFADLISIHRTYVGAIERGERNITLKILEKISKVLKIQPYKLLIKGSFTDARR